MTRLKRYLNTFLPPIIIIFGTILVILFSQGWRIDIKEKTVINTGILDIISDPKGATLFLNGEDMGNTPIVIDSLPPGTHKLELRKENYISWQKNIEVAEGKVLKIETNLFEERTQLTQASDIPLERIFFSQKGGEALIISLRNGNQGILKNQLNPSALFLKNHLSKVLNLYEPGFFDLLTSEYNIDISPNFTKAIISVKQTKEDTLARAFLFDLANDKSNLTEITEYLTNANIEWTHNDEYILFDSNSSIYTFNIKTFQKSVITERNFKNLWTFTNDKVYYAYFDPSNNSHNIFSANLDGTKREELVIDKFNIKDLSLIFANPEYDMLLLSTEEDPYTNPLSSYSALSQTFLFDLESKEAKKLFDYKIKIVNISPDQRYLLFKRNDGDEFFTYDLEYSKLSTPFSIPAENLTWTPNGLKLFYRYQNIDGNNILGSIDPDGSNQYDLLNLENYNGSLDTDFGFTTDSRKVYIPLVSNYNYINELVNTDNEKFEEIVLFEIELR